MKFVLFLLVLTFPLYLLGCGGSSENPPSETAAKGDAAADPVEVDRKGPPEGVDHAEPTLETLRKEGVQLPSEEEIVTAADEIAQEIAAGSDLGNFQGSWKPDADELKAMVEKEALRIQGEGGNVSPPELREALQAALRSLALSAVDKHIEAFLGKDGAAAVEKAASRKAKEWGEKLSAKEKGVELQKALSSRLKILIQSRLKRHAREKLQSSLPAQIQPILPDAIRSYMRGKRGRGR